MIILILGLKMNIHRRPPFHHLNQVTHQNPPLVSAFFADDPRVVICMTYIRGVDIKWGALPLNKIEFIEAQGRVGLS